MPGQTGGVKTYGQYCPIARTSELFAERWTPIIIRNLLTGCRTFGELLDGAPGISKALLTQRLGLLEEEEILVKEPLSSGRGYRYELTEKGSALKAVTDAMGAWGAKWLELQSHHIDPEYVLWATCKLVDVERVPKKGLVARIELRDKPKLRLWMLLKRPHAEICSTYPGRPEDLIVRTDSGTLARWHLRQITYEQAAHSGLIKIEATASTAKAFVACIRPSPYARFTPA